MEYVKVTFKEDRAVMMNDQNNGRTNKILRVGAGFYIITLDGEKNFSPKKMTCKISGTSELEPKVIKFEANNNE